MFPVLPKSGNGRIESLKASLQLQTTSKRSAGLLPVAWMVCEPRAWPWGLDQASNGSLYGSSTAGRARQFLM